MLRYRYKHTTKMAIFLLCIHHTNSIIFHIKKQMTMKPGMLIKSDIWPKIEHTRVIFYVRRIGLYLYKNRIYGTISIYILKGLAFVYQLM